MSIKDLAQTIATRKNSNPDASWTAKLLSDPDKAAEKFGEEAIEAIIEATKGNKSRLASEAADVLYHLLVMCAAHDVTFDDIEMELASRSAQSGLTEKANR